MTDTIPLFRTVPTPDIWLARSSDSAQTLRPQSSSRKLNQGLEMRVRFEPLDVRACRRVLSAIKISDPVPLEEEPKTKPHRFG